MTRPLRRAAATTVVALAVAAAASACSGGDGGSDGEPSGSGSSTSTHPVDTQVTWGEVTGTLAPADRRHLATKVGQIVDGWTVAAYLGGDYPRRDFADSWPGFTRGAREEAHADRSLMSNEDIGSRIDGVEPYRSRVRIDVLAVHRRPVGVTAHVALTFGTTGEVERRVSVRGRLFLTPTEQGWKVFAYDVTKGTT